MGVFMPEMELVYLTGNSGRQYPFYLYRADHRFAHVSGVFAMAKEKNDKEIFYIGESADIAEKLDKLQENGRLKKRETKFIFFHLEFVNALRAYIEDDLIKNYYPECNHQYQ